MQNLIDVLIGGAGVCLALMLGAWGLLALHEYNHPLLPTYNEAQKDIASRHMSRVAMKAALAGTLVYVLFNLYK